MIYESQCGKCGTIHEYFAKVADADKDAPKCCGRKTKRGIFTPPQVGAMSWTGHKGVFAGGRWCETGGDYKRMMKEGGYIPLDEAKSEAKKAKAEIRTNQKKKLRRAVEKAMRDA